MAKKQSSQPSMLKITEALIDEREAPLTRNGLVAALIPAS